MTGVTRITTGRNGAEVEEYEIMLEKNLNGMVVAEFYNLPAAERARREAWGHTFVRDTEFACTRCRTIVESSEGHEEETCRDACREHDF